MHTLKMYITQIHRRLKYQTYELSCIIGTWDLYILENFRCQEVLQCLAVIFPSYASGSKTDSGVVCKNLVVRVRYVVMHVRTTLLVFLQIC
jgi:hypothetical protein